MSKDKKKVKLSVRKLVEFIFRHGDLNNRFASNVKAIEGTKVHKKLQDRYKVIFYKKENIRNYNSEVPLKYETEYGEFIFLVEGRADGIIVKNNCTIIDEIKTVSIPLNTIDQNYNPVHMAQAMCYGYIYGVQNNLKKIYIQLTYYNIEDKKIKFIKKQFTLKELKVFFTSVLNRYYRWAEFESKWSCIRNASIHKLQFPFKSYRKGQRNMAITVYGTIRDGKRLFAQAPTGIGKTISTIFPSLKSMEKNITSKIFYLTAKTITRTTAENTVKMMLDKGLRLKTLTITAKEKICFKDEIICTPEECKFAKGHYDRVNDAIFCILNKEDLITGDKVCLYSKKFKVCPFELSLDLALFCDFIICDYNYAFNPKVYLKRFFEDGNGEYILLIDEAHNLVDRSRDMLSAEIYRKPFLHIKKFVKDDVKLLKSLNKINSYMIKLKRGFEDVYFQKDKLVELYFMLRNFSYKVEKWMIENPKSEGYDQVLKVYFDANSFIKIGDMYDSNFVTYMENIEDDIKIKVLCLDSSVLLDKMMEKAQSAVLFSATLSPIKYFKKILGGREDDYNITIQSPFKPQNRLILISSDISTVYKNREESYMPISKYLNEVVMRKKGNYMAFFPSYYYMECVYKLFINMYPEINTVIQKPGMSEQEKEKFLMNFKEKVEKPFIAFAVLGGTFSESIDLKGNKLIGTMIIGVGIPQICFERNIIKKYFDKKSKHGYEYSYMYPGMNKVMQAAGRVIRTENDRGIIFLMDRRFLNNDYKKLFPAEWYPYNIVNSTNYIGDIIEKFWKNID